MFLTITAKRKLDKKPLVIIEQGQPDMSKEARQRIEKYFGTVLLGRLSEGDTLERVVTHEKGDKARFSVGSYDDKIEMTGTFLKTITEKEIKQLLEVLPEPSYNDTETHFMQLIHLEREGVLKLDELLPVTVQPDGTAWHCYDAEKYYKLRKLMLGK